MEKVRSACKAFTLGTVAESLEISFSGQSGCQPQK